VRDKPGGWIGVDFDGTLSHYDPDGGWRPPGVYGPPIPEMVERVRGWLARGIEVRIVTARAQKEPYCTMSYEDIVKTIQDWCEEHVGSRLRVTNEKDLKMIELWDDRAVQVVINTGVRVDSLTRLPD
jgi:hypothetical protein